MTKLEEVARAIALDLGENPDELSVLIQGREGKRPIWEGFESTARAAIEALRQPTPDMYHAAVMTHVHENGGIEHSPGLSWKAMIDAILSEGDGAKP